VLPVRSPWLDARRSTVNEMLPAFADAPSVMAAAAALDTLELYLPSPLVNRAVSCALIDSMPVLIPFMPSTWSWTAP
jgi:hypothetical protein